MERPALIAREWLERGRSAVLARVTNAAGLGPRATDEALLIDSTGATDGSLLGGAADDAVLASAREVLGRDEPRFEVLSINVAEDDAEDAGLTCGGFVNVLVQRLDDIPAGLWDALSEGRPAALSTVVMGGQGAVVHRPGQEAQGTFGSAPLDDLARSTAGALLAQPGHHVRRAKLEDVELVVEAWHPVPRLVVVGASGLSDALVEQCRLLGWPASIVTTLDEAQAAVATLGSSDLIVVVDHDHDLATVVLGQALREGVGYVGALGSRHTQATRLTRLQAAGVGDDDLARYHCPTGLDLGSRTAAETAVSIVAEVLSVRSGRTGAPLQATSGRIGGS